VEINKKHLFWLALAAFLVHQCINFFFFPLDNTFADERRFIREAIRLSTIGEFRTGADRAWEMPFTAILYSFFYSLTNSREGLIVVARIFQSLCLIAQGLLLFAISLKLFKDRSAALLTCVSVVFYPFFVFYQGLLLSETIFNTTLAISFYFLYCWYENQFKIDRYFFWANFFFVLSIYIKGTVALLPPFIFLFAYYFTKFKLYGAFKIFFASIIIYIILLSPWWIRNYTIFNQFVPFTTSSSLVLFVGNNPLNQDGGCELSLYKDTEPYTTIENIKNELVRSSRYKEEAVRYIAGNKEAFIKMVITKFKRFYSIVPNSEVYSAWYYKYVSVLTYGVFLFFALVSIVKNVSIFNRLVPVYTLAVYITLIHIVFISSIRYRLPLEQFMILLSTPVITSLLSYLRSKSTHMFKATNI